MKFEKRYSDGLFFSTFYTFSKAIDSQDGDNDGTGVAPIQNRGLEKARAGYDRTHRLIGTVNYELPFGLEQEMGDLTAGRSTPSAGWKSRSSKPSRAATL